VLVWRFGPFPCPSWLVPLLENPYVDAVAGAERLLDRAGVGPGMQVLDAGCGPGRLTLPAARRVGPGGRVVAFDLQPAMLERLEGRLAEAGLHNVECIRGGLGEGALPEAAFDVAFLVTVLGEVPDKEAALRDIHHALRLGGRLCVTEVLPDPHYQTVRRVRALAQRVGFREERYLPGWLSFTLELGKYAPPA